ncbi:MAG: signal peptidase II [Bacteriovoracaceae bacterium]|jgi:signal peptidase II
MKKLSLYILLIVVLVIIDQVSKIYVAGNFYLGESVPVIDGFFNFTYVRNPGAAFGFGGAFHNWIRYSLFLALPVLACLWLVVLLVKSLAGSKVMTYAYTLILAGAIGNLIDRFRLDYVIDFFDFYIGRHHFATFNVADSAITIAAGLIILDFFQEKKRNNSASST